MSAPRDRDGALAFAGVALAGASGVGLALLDPFDPDPSKATTRYLLVLPWNAAIVTLLAVGIHRLGRARSEARRPLVLLAVALGAWLVGQTIWTTYNFLGVDVPWPSLADVGYATSALAATLGLFDLFRKYRRKLEGVDLALAIVFPLATLVFTYTLVSGAPGSATGDPVARALSIAYPTDSSLRLALAVLILQFTPSSEITSPIRRIALASLVLVAADWGFIATLDRGTYFSGNWVDVLYLAGTTLFAGAVAGFAGPLTRRDPSPGLPDGPTQGLKYDLPPSRVEDPSERGKLERRRT